MADRKFPLSGLTTLLILMSVIPFLCGCSTLKKWTVRSQSPEEKQHVGSAEKPRLVGDIARPLGLNSVRVEGVAIVNNLDNTGSDPAPSTYRTMVLRDLKKRGVEEATAFIASPSTSLVLIRAQIPPGIQKGDRFDIEVQTPSRSETKSLHGGWLLEAELREMAYLDNTFKSGNLLALGTGPVIVGPRKEDERQNQLSQCRGLVLGGGVAQKTRNLGLKLPSENSAMMIKIAKNIADSINSRFYTYRNTTRIGVAQAKNNQYIELMVHPRYKDNVHRYMSVIRSVAIVDSDELRIKRLAELKVRLMEPITAMYAALELEAMGGQGAIDVLREGMNSADTVVRFYSAESLAYLDQPDCTEVLKQIARTEEAFRANALGALAALDDINSYEALVELMQSPSAETRYGAFRAMWYMRPLDPVALGATLGKDKFTLHYVDSTQPNLIHLTKKKRPEIVLFGQNFRIQPPLLLDAGNNILIKSDGGNEITITKFSISEPDQKRVVSTDLSEVISTVAELGATYPDIIELIQAASAKNILNAKIAFDAVPKGGRTYLKTPSGKGERLAEEEYQREQESFSDEDRMLASGIEADAEKFDSDYEGETSGTTAQAEDQGDVLPDDDIVQAEADENADEDRDSESGGDAVEVASDKRWYQFWK